MCMLHDHIEHEHDYECYIGRGTHVSMRRTTLTDHRNTSGSFSEPVLTFWSTVSQKPFELRVAAQHGYHHMCIGLARRLCALGQR
eukprot:2494930-Pyramimonas_sp.AAC.1